MIKPSDTVEELLENYPGINIYLMKKGIYCVKCGEPVWATIGELIEEKGLDKENTIAELNRAFSSEK